MLVISTLEDVRQKVKHRIPNNDFCQCVKLKARVPQIRTFLVIGLIRLHADKDSKIELEHEKTSPVNVCIVYLARELLAEGLNPRQWSCSRCGDRKVLISEFTLEYLSQHHLPWISTEYARSPAAAPKMRSPNGMAVASRTLLLCPYSAYRRMRSTTANEMPSMFLECRHLQMLTTFIGQD